MNGVHITQTNLLNKYAGAKQLIHLFSLWVSKEGAKRMHKWSKLNSVAPGRVVVVEIGRRDKRTSSQFAVAMKMMGLGGLVGIEDEMQVFQSLEAAS